MLSSTSGAWRAAVCLLALLGGSVLPRAQTNPFVYGMHDGNAKVYDLLTHRGQPRGWVLLMAWMDGYRGAIHPEVRAAAQRGLGVVVRIHHGTAAPGPGTLPVEARYDDFANKVATFVSKHIAWCKYYIIGNEPNLCSEWPFGGARDGRCNGGVHKERITAQRYVRCFRKCYAATAKVAKGFALIPAPSSVWSGKFTYSQHGFDTDDFLCWTRQVLAGIPAREIGGLAFHPKTRGHVASELTSETMSRAAFGCAANEKVHWFFRVYRDQLARVPPALRDRPVFFTELNPHDLGWKDTNNGYVQAAYDELDRWNRTPGTQKVTAMMLYRWDDGDDRWDVHSRPGVQQDLRAAVAKGYRSGGGGRRDLDAAFVGHRAPSTLLPGARGAVTVTVRNTGRLAWTGSGAANAVRLGAGPGNRLLWTRFAFGGYSRGPTDQRAFLGGTVAPDGVTTVRFEVVAPSIPGRYRFEARMVKDGVAWFGPTLGVDVVVRRAAPLDARFEAASLPALVTAGSQHAIGLRVRNTGTTAWSGAGAGNPVRLGAGAGAATGNPGPNELWWTNYQAGGFSRNPLDQRAFLAATVAPGAVTEVRFDLLAGAVAGSRRFEARMVREGVAWFGEAFSRRIDVRPAPAFDLSVRPAGPTRLMAGATLAFRLRLHNPTASWQVRGVVLEIVLPDGSVLPWIGPGPLGLPPRLDVTLRGELPTVPSVPTGVYALRVRAFDWNSKAATDLDSFSFSLRRGP